MLSRDMRLLEEIGEDSIELVVEISESDRLRLRTMIAIFN